MRDIREQDCVNIDGYSIYLDKYIDLISHEKTTTVIIYETRKFFKVYQNTHQ